MGPRVILAQPVAAVGRWGEMQVYRAHQPAPDPVVETELSQPLPLWMRAYGWILVIAAVWWGHKWNYLRSGRLLLCDSKEAAFLLALFTLMFAVVHLFERNEGCSATFSTATQTMTVARNRWFFKESLAVPFEEVQDFVAKASTERDWLRAWPRNKIAVRELFVVRRTEGPISLGRLTVSLDSWDSPDAAIESDRVAGDVVIAKLREELSLAMPDWVPGKP